jgi:hypothetical protein
LIQLVQNDGGQLTGRFEEVLLQPSGKLVDTNAALSGAINNGTVVVTIADAAKTASPQGK